jgi:hypothetical protein
LNLQIDLIVDDKPNFLYYSRDKLISGNELFGSYVDIMFDLKEKKVNGSKAILNILYGVLSERLFVEQNIKIDEEYIIPSDCHFRIKPSKFSDDVILIKYAERDQQFKTPYGRLKPFLLAKGRSIISKIMQPIENNVKRCHTDGIIFNSIQYDVLKYGSSIGDLVYEGYTDKCTVLNSNIVTGF